MNEAYIYINIHIYVCILNPLISVKYIHIYLYMIIILTELHTYIQLISFDVVNNFHQTLVLFQIPWKQNKYCVFCKLDTSHLLFKIIKMMWLPRILKMCIAKAAELEGRRKITVKEKQPSSAFSRNYNHQFLQLILFHQPIAPDSE